MLKIKTEDGEADAVILGVYGASLLGHWDGQGRLIGSWQAADETEFWQLWNELGGTIQDDHCVPLNT
jgi:hypothetical protein